MKGDAERNRGFGGDGGRWKISRYIYDVLSPELVDKFKNTFPKCLAGRFECLLVVDVTSH